MKAKKKAAKRKPVTPKTRRSTAGPGFAFEDQVAAWFVLKILKGQPLPLIEGRGVRLQMQVGSLGWLVDDILITAVTDAGGEARLAISCKSNTQVTTAGFPPDFVELAWKQWSGPAIGPMRRQTDGLMLVTRVQHPGFEGVWTDLKDWARGADLALALSQMCGPATHRRVFDSVRAPAKKANIRVADADVVGLIQRVDVEPLDFDTAKSRTQKSAVAEARSLLTNNTAAEGQSLWAELIARIRDTRLATGTLDIADLWRILRGRYLLKDHPDFGASWSRLSAVSNDYRAGILTTLPNGWSLQRQDDSAKVAAVIRSNSVCVIYGDSGTGKSAIVRLVLDTAFSTANQVWLEPEQFEVALSEARRATMGLVQPLLETLDASVHAENILVIDAAERLSDRYMPRATTLVAELLKRNQTSGPLAWRIVVVGQTIAWEKGELQKLAGVVSPARVEVGDLSVGEVGTVLQSMEGLRWLASHGEAVSALANVRTLAWVVQAVSRFQDSGGPTSLSLVAIADRLWSYWTDDQVSVQRLLMRLAARDAAFEHSFAISQLDGADAQAFDRRSSRCPLRVDQVSNRIKFEHDLAADWARFQQLKEIAGETAQWAGLAGNPLWNGALRMFGQYLLRQRSGQYSAWDEAFEVAEKAQNQLPIAADILLDALFLDPQAEALLNERADMLFENRATRLLRLLRRFEHIASVPGVDPAVLSSRRDLGLYIEARYRTPIFARWPDLARFLSKHCDRISGLILPIVSLLCVRWLTNVPSRRHSSAAPVPLRREFSALALSTARALQLELVKGVIYLDDDIGPVHQAAFAAAPDLPTEAAEWALEMAQRRSYHQDIMHKLVAHRREQAELHRKRLENDASYRERHEQRRKTPTIIHSGRRLPPWALGPRRPVDRHFRDTVLRSPTFHTFMRAVPTVAREVLLAVIIEDSPEERYHSNPYDDELGIEYDSESYPTAYWKSPLYAFLSINSDVALDTFCELIEFATDRWEHEASRNSHFKPTSISLKLADGTVRQFRGNGRVFNWSQLNSHHTGQLHSALAALERWLCDMIDHGIDVSPYVDKLFHRTTSVAVLGVLTNVGKRNPDLFAGPLLPLLTEHKLYIWDYHRVEKSAYAFDALAWARSGELIFEMAKSWVLAPYRGKKVLQVAAELIRQHRNVAETILAATTQWDTPNDEKEALEFRILVAQLDFHNYRSVRDPVTGKDKTEFTYPEDIAAAISAFQENNARTQQILMFPENCRQFLNGSGVLDEKQVRAVVELMFAADGDEKVDLEDEMRRPARVAAAAVLLLRAKEWLATQEPVRTRAQLIIDVALGEVVDADEARFRHYTYPSYLEFAAHFVVERWMEAPSPVTDEAVMLVLTSGDDRAVNTVGWQAFRHRFGLGARWWRLQYLALLWAGLTVLAPRYGDDDAVRPRWLRWRRWLRSRSLSRPNAGITGISPLAIAERFERFEVLRWQKRYAREDRQFVREPGRRMSGGLDTHFLEIMFAWLFERRSAPAVETEDRRCLIQAFWAYESWCRIGSAKDAEDSYSPMHPIGYKIVAEIAHLTIESPIERASALWAPILDLGPRGHYAIRSFLSEWFGQLAETTDAGEFAKRWRPMIEYIFNKKDWTSGRQWHYGQQLERQVLGFDASSCLARLPTCGSLIASMRDLYRTWAAKRTHPVKATYQERKSREKVRPLTRELTGTHDDSNGFIRS